MTVISIQYLNKVQLDYSLILCHPERSEGSADVIPSRDSSTSLGMTNITNNQQTVSTRKVGASAEEMACRVLAEKGYKILERNFQIRGGEIDIIAEHKGVLVFIEVKARFSHEYGLPAESITPHKMRFLRRAAQFFIHQHHLYKKQARFDVVTIDYVLGNPKIEIIENAF